MSSDRVFLDTSFVQALFDRRDGLHARARVLRPVLDTASEVWITEAVLIEVGNALSSRNREAAVEFIGGCSDTKNIRIVAIAAQLISRALTLYRSHRDKTWGMTDCLSFVVMRDAGLTDALTADSHFRQAGFRALLLEEP